MAEPLKLFILAGEASGDRIAADLVGRLQQRVPLALAGVGGEELAGRGLKSFYPMSNLAVMGVRDVVARLPLLLWRIEQTARAILRARPDIVVLVDAQVFSQRLAARLRRGGFTGPIVLYVAPSVWARNPERAARLKPLFDEVLAVLPFEPAVMARLGGPATSYVGHPALAEAGHAAEEGRSIALLPGSRKGELRRHLPLFRETAIRLAERGEGLEFYLPTLASLASTIAAEVRKWPVPVRVVSARQERARLYASTRLAIACAGTATLELAMADVPMVVTYVMEPAQARKFRALGRPSVGLPNIILGTGVTPERVAERIEAAELVSAAGALLDSPEKRAAQRLAFARLRLLMTTGTPDAPRQDPAERILSLVARDDQRLSIGT